MIRQQGTITAGETFSYSVSPRQAGETIRAALKPATQSGDIPAASVPETAVFTASEGTGLWTLTLSAAQTAALAPGLYVFDERITLSGGAVQVTDPGMVRVLPSVTGAGT